MFTFRGRARGHGPGQGGGALKGNGLTAEALLARLEAELPEAEDDRRLASEALHLAAERGGPTIVQ
eukprot:9322159-Pyramimonas_sp.AAC.1